MTIVCSIMQRPELEWVFPLYSPQRPETQLMDRTHEVERGAYLAPLPRMLEQVSDAAPTSHGRHRSALVMKTCPEHVLRHHLAGRPRGFPAVVVSSKRQKLSFRSLIDGKHAFVRTVVRARYAI